MVLSLEAVDFLLVLVGHTGHTVVVLPVQLVHAELVGGVDFLNGLHVLLVALSGTLLEALDLRAKGISLRNKLLLIKHPKEHYHHDQVLHLRNQLTTLPMTQQSISIINQFLLQLFW